MSIPVVRTQATGAGDGSPLYGSNVRLNPGRYRINVTVNGMDLVFFTDI